MLLFESDISMSLSNSPPLPRSIHGLFCALLRSILTHPATIQYSVHFPMKIPDAAAQRHFVSFVTTVPVHLLLCFGKRSLQERIVTGITGCLQPSCFLLDLLLEF